MPRPERFVPRCSLCDRMQNDSSDLTFLAKRGLEPIHICASKRCWDAARERGYISDDTEPTPGPEH